MGSSATAVTHELTAVEETRSLPVLRRRAPIENALILLAGVGAGASAAASGFYSLSVWGLVSIGVMAVLAGLCLVERRRPPAAAIVAVAGLTGLWAWSLISRDWSPSPAQASLVAHRWALYAALLAALVIVLGRGALGWLALAGATAGVLGVAAYIEIEMLSGDGGHLFIARRLNSPLGYVNGQGGYFLLAMWPLIAFAERGRPRVLRGPAVAAAALLAALLFLTESRGIALGFAVAAIVVVAAVPGRQRRLWIILPIIAGLVAIGGHLLDVYHDPVASDGLPNDATVRTAARWALAMALCVGAIWGALDLVAAGVARRGAAAQRALRRISTVGLVAVAVGLTGLGIASADWVRDTMSQQYHAFVQLGGPKQSSRFLSGGGHRYDYWRIAMHEFRAEPVRGVGAGGYPPTYFLERRTDEDITQPHSVELQVLAELGVVGAAFLLAFVVAVLVGFGRMARAGRRDPGSAAIAVGGGGAFLAWLAHTSVDWMHVIPGLTAIALIGAATLFAPRDVPAVTTRPRPGEATGLRLHHRRRWDPERAASVAGRAVVAAILTLAAVWVGRLTLAEHYRTLGREHLRSDPVAALRNSSRALALDDDSVETYYLRSAALARLNLYRPARAALFRAVKREQRNFVPWVLIGDLALRRGLRRQALSAYRRAARLNPRDAIVRDLARGNLPRLGRG
jgi:hypothetical protein